MSRKAKETSETLQGFRELTITKKIKAELQLFVIAGADGIVGDVHFSHAEALECADEGEVVLRYVLAEKQSG